MAPHINQEIGLRRDPIAQDTASEISEPTTLPSAWESPLNPALPRTARPRAGGCDNPLPTASRVWTYLS